MVEISKIKDSQNQVTRNVFEKYSLLSNDTIRIKELLKRHANYTNSPKAKIILDDFDKKLKRFYKILPIDFKNALLKSGNLVNNTQGTKQWQK